jgi:hypothetical protein
MPRYLDKPAQNSDGTAGERIHPNGPMDPLDRGPVPSAYKVKPVASGPNKVVRAATMADIWKDNLTQLRRAKDQYSESGKAGTIPWIMFFPDNRRDIYWLFRLEMELPNLHEQLNPEVDFGFNGGIGVNKAIFGTDGRPVNKEVAEQKKKHAAAKPEGVKEECINTQLMLAAAAPASAAAKARLSPSLAAQSPAIPVTGPTLGCLTSKVPVPMAATDAATRPLFLNMSSRSRSPAAGAALSAERTSLQQPWYSPSCFSDLSPQVVAMAALVAPLSLDVETDSQPSFFF